MQTAMSISIEENTFWSNRSPWKTWFYQQSSWIVTGSKFFAVNIQCIPHRHMSMVNFDVEDVDHDLPDTLIPAIHVC